MKAVGDDVKKDVQQVKQEVSASTDASKARIDSLEQVIDSLALVQKRMKVELSMLSSKIAEISDRNDSHHEELLYRLDLLLGKSDKILSKKVVVNGQTVEAPADSAAISAEKVQPLDSLFNTARADYHKGEVKLAYSEFKQIYEESKQGQIASDALYWMGVCLSDANQMDKAKTVFGRVVKAFPDSPKTCASLLKLSNIAASEGDLKTQKQYLQTILGTKGCSDSNEFLQAAEILETILNSETATEPAPVDSTKK
jgi:TolA-binding protein